jgi:NADH dehydrogenase FAD-containing subunit
MVVVNGVLVNSPDSYREMAKSSLHHLKINFNKNLTVNGVKPSSFSFGEGQEDEAKNRKSL